MKKIYAMLAALALTSVSVQAARKINFYLGDQLIEAGQTYQFNEIEFDEFTGYTIEPKVYAVSESATSNAKFVFDCVTGQTIQVCIGECVMAPVIKKEKVAMKAGEKLDCQVHYGDWTIESLDKVPTDITIEISGQDGADPRTATEFTLVLNSKNGSAVTVFGDQSDVKAVGRTLAYKVNGNCTVTLYNILGVKAMQAPIAGSGTLDLSTLPRGIYVYTVEGAAALSGKISIP